MAQDDRPEIDRWARESGLSHEDVPTYRSEFEHLTYSRALLSEGKPTEALQLLGRLLHLAESKGRQGRVIEILVLQALAHHARGDKAVARTAIGRALVLAEPEGCIRTFLDEGAPMAALLAGAERHDVHPTYARRLRAGFAAPPDTGPVGSAAGSGALAKGHEAALVEPLTEQEREVLGLIAAGASNRVIANKLVVSLGTVKKHGNNIFSKLGVQSRTQAIARARALGLL
jgi:LuxR family maltose regulon positive regulatory protein